MTVIKDFMLCPTGRGLAATRRPFGVAHLPVWHSTRTRTSSHYQTTQHKNKVSTLSGDLTRKNVKHREKKHLAENKNQIIFLLINQII
jgi:hypothetical protein